MSSYVSEAREAPSEFGDFVIPGWSVRLCSPSESSEWMAFFLCLTEARPAYPCTPRAWHTG